MSTVASDPSHKGSRHADGKAREIEEVVQFNRDCGGLLVKRSTLLLLQIMGLDSEEHVLHGTCVTSRHVTPGLLVSMSGQAGSQQMRRTSPIWQIKGTQNTRGQHHKHV